MKMPPCPNCGEPHGMSLWQRVNIGSATSKSCGHCGAELSVRDWEFFVMFFPAILIIPRLMPDDWPWTLWLPAITLAAIIWCYLGLIITAKLIPLKAKQNVSS